MHYKVSIICGISEPRYSASELKRLNAQNERIYDIGGKKLTGYECTQAMRKLERGVRSQKTIRETARASGDTALVKKCTERIKAYKTKYSEISNITGIPEEPKRMSNVRMPKTSNNSPINLTNSDSGGIINKKLSDRAINIHNETQNGVFSFDDIEKDLQNSEIGKETVKYIEDEGIFVTMNYDVNVPANVMGQIRGKDIEIFATNCESLEDAVDTLIHEVAHKKYNWLYTQADEINCYIMEYKHRHGEIKQEDLKKIIDFVSNNYGYLPKGDFNGFGIY